MQCQQTEENMEIVEHVKTISGISGISKVEADSFAIFDKTSTIIFVHFDKNGSLYEAFCKLFEKCQSAWMVFFSDKSNFVQTPGNYGVVMMLDVSILRLNISQWINAQQTFLILSESYPENELLDVFELVWVEIHTLQVFIQINDTIFFYNPFLSPDLQKGSTNKLPDNLRLNPVNIQLFDSIYARKTSVSQELVGPDAEIMKILQTRMNFTSNFLFLYFYSPHYLKHYLKYSSHFSRKCCGRQLRS